ncbi:MAG: DUF6261 family protein [Tannerella sp.]|jgi:hypothetical protein|nr:DUF6261 family protein [Tannerella sp.]
MVHFIHSLYPRELRNNLHFEFFSSLLKLLQLLGSGIAYLVDAIQRLATLLLEEDRALDVMRRYDETGLIDENDRGRDSAFYAAHEIIRAMLRHFEPYKAEAARRLEVIFANYAKAPHLPLPDESAAFHSLLQQLSGHQEDINLLGLNEWVERMRQCNENVRTLTAQRESEAAHRAQLRTKAIRAEVDATYHDIVGKLEAAATLEGPEAYTELFREINARIDEYKNILAREKGRRKKNNETNNENTDQL